MPVMLPATYNIYTINKGKNIIVEWVLTYIYTSDIVKCASNHTLHNVYYNNQPQWWPKSNIFGFMLQAKH